MTKFFKLITVLLSLIFFVNCFAQEKKEKLSLEQKAFYTDYFVGGEMISKSKFRSILRTDKDAYREFQKGNTISGTCMTIGILGDAALLALLLRRDNNIESSKLIRPIILLSLFALGGKLWGNKIKRDGVSMYNSQGKSLRLFGSTDGLTVGFAF